MSSVSRSDGLHLSFSFGRARRTFAIGRAATLAVVLIASAATIWSLVAVFYVCFHDSLLASLMSRQADMQYAYEDQIATLRTDLEREASRNIIDRRMIETTLHDLTVRSGRLEGRAATIDRLVASSDVGRERHPASGHVGSSAVQVTPSDDAEAGPGASSSDPTRLRLRDADDHASLHPDAITRHLAAVETDQLDQVTRLREPLLRETRRLAAALAATGLRRRVLGDRPQDTGGPFVPLGATESQSFDVQLAVLRDALEQRERLVAAVDRVPLHVPLDGPIEVSSRFGPRLDPFLGRPALHTGIDLRQTGGDGVHATAGGIVTAAGPTGGYGNMVEIDHGAGIVTRYAHLSAVDVVVHQHVATGAVVGRVGSSGRATGPHLHYETRIDGEPVDPATFLIASSRLAER